MAEGGLLVRLGLHRPELRAWAMYDWANSVFWATVIQIFPLYFASVAVQGVPAPVATARFATATTVGMVIVAILSPILGAAADYAAAKKALMAGFLTLGVVATAALYFVGPGDWILGAALFVVGNIAVTATFVFYESFLPHVAREDELDRVATAGYALGYLGGGLLMAINVLMIQKPALFRLPDSGTATRVAFVTAAVWWLVFSIPMFLQVPEPPRRLETGERAGMNAIVVALARLKTTLRELRSFRDAFLLLLAFMIYNDGIQTIIRLAGIYGREIGIAQSSLITAILLVQFVGIPFSFLFGMLAFRIGPKASIFLALAVYGGITVVGYFMRTAAHFYVLAMLVAMVQGGSQALSRSLFASMIPRHKSSEFFGFFGVFDKFAGIFGPALFAIMISATGASRNAILATAVFFVVGGLLLGFVDVEAGRRTAREAEARAA